nr:MAG TPA: hypothetical protein [Caudoviricetes sp.]
MSEYKNTLHIWIIHHILFCLVLLMFFIAKNS